MESDQFEWVEEQIPLQGIEKTAVELIEMYGGEISSSSSDEITFFLPRRRGVAASGSIDCRLSWGDGGSDGGGTVKIATARNANEKAQKIALLIAGVFGASIWLLWPFFPNLGAASWLGGVIAFAAYFLTLKKTDGGLAFDLLQRLASSQREGAETGAEQA
ncbi:MAG TPA: hypothetical protein VHL58_10240 [Thermoanaerobaculia bacterium]|nr:hypothetical protein [Thermoanaerobaculia bacterium]